MDGLTLFDKLLVYGLVFAMATAGLFPFLRPVFREWKRTLCSSRLRAAYAAISLLVLVYAGGSLDKQPVGNPLIQEILLGPNVVESLRDASPSVPQWYQDLGYSTVDTDGDGIPDYWERRTHTNRLVSDASSDSDGDGVDNAEEFLHQCDPLTKDTDGDGLTDREEIDGALAGMAGFDPLVRCDYPADASDEEAWGTGWNPVCFVGVNASGFPLNVGYPDEAEDNVDVLITVDSTRYAELDWVDGTGSRQLLLPPCTNLVLRLRIPATESSSVSLSAAAGATGLWKAALRAEWDARRGVPIERDRIHSGSGWFMDAKTSPAVFSGALPGTFDATNAPMRSGGLRQQNSNQNAPQLSITMFARRAFDLEMSAVCRVHGPNPTFLGSFTNAVPPFLWTVNGREYTTPDPVLNLPFTADEYHVGCFDSGRYTLLPLGTNAVFHVGRCQNGPATNVVGAGWTSTHNPTNAMDHLPFVEEVVEQFAPLCPVYTNTVVHAGWTHNTLILWIRNLVRILTGDPWDDETDHCFAYTWMENGVRNLWAFVDESTLPFTNLLEIAIDGQIGDGIICFGTNPEPYHPDIHHVELRMKDSNVALDRMWIVVNGTQTKPIFTEWFDRNATNMAWVATLPRPYAQLTIATDFWGDEYAVDPEPGSPYLWSKPKPTGGNLLHHDAAYSMRAPANAAGHGNQACYRKDGSLIRSGIAGGTADFAAGALTSVGSHIQEDVNPFLHSLHLDGNPCGITTFNNLSRPCLRQGEYIDEYIQCRPVVQP